MKSQDSLSHHSQQHKEPFCSRSPREHHRGSLSNSHATRRRRSAQRQTVHRSAPRPRSSASVAFWRSVARAAAPGARGPRPVAGPTPSSRSGRSSGRWKRRRRGRRGQHGIDPKAVPDTAYGKGHVGTFSGKSCSDMCWTVVHDHGAHEGSRHGAPCGIRWSFDRHRRGELRQRRWAALPVSRSVGGSRQLERDPSF